MKKVKEEKIERRNFLKKTAGVIGVVAAGPMMSQAAFAMTGLDSGSMAIGKKTQLGRETKHYGVELAADKPEFAGFWLDSLGKGRAWPGAILGNNLSQEYTTDTRKGWFNYYPKGQEDAKTCFKFENKAVLIRSEAKTNNAVEPFVLKFNLKGTNPAFATLIGKMEKNGEVKLPNVLHIPGQGTVKISARSEKEIPLHLGYEVEPILISEEQSKRTYVKITFPVASEQCHWIEFKLEVMNAYPKIAALEDDARFDGYRRCWLNIIQMSAEHRMMANNVAATVCAFVYHEYSEITSLTGDLVEGVTGVQVLRDSMNRFLDDGQRGYGMAKFLAKYKGHHSYPEATLDTWPSLLIAAHHYYQASNDKQWLTRQIDKLINWGDQSLSTDKNGNGLIEYHQSGNAGDCYYRPANWWDGINFGHEDAYSNALAYRGFRGLAKMAKIAGRDVEAKKFDEAAKNLKSAYYKTFYNPETGMLAGWKSRDGKLHDYAFTFIQGMAITYGLIDDEEIANKLLDATVEKMKEVGYNHFEMGLPGNLITIPPEDYFQGLMEPRWDKTRHPFQTYENGGASANHSYYLISAFYKLGRIEEGDMILLPILKSFNECKFQGFDGPGLSYDWKSWDGKPHGYEGMLVDNYLAVKAVLVREGLVDPESGYWSK
jgi:hypothetical protein